MPMNPLLYYPITVDFQIDRQGSNNVNVSLLLRLQVTFRKSLNLVSLRNFVPAYCVREMADDSLDLHLCKTLFHSHATYISKLLYVRRAF